ncbi:MAG: amidohydrolase family protein, partial [Rhodococcus sp. (in: high G+C Gram-positive bacteria)]
MAALHLRGIGLPDAEPIELWIVDGLISFEPMSGAETIVESGWITPG